MNPTPKDTTIAPTDAPPARGKLGYQRLQIASIVLVQNGAVSVIPPHVAAAVVVDEDHTKIVALCGPESDLSAVQDAVVFGQAYALRDALRQLVNECDMLLQLAAMSDGACYGTVATHEVRRLLEDKAKAALAVLEASDPMFLELKPKSAEEQLAEARQGYDASLNGDTSQVATNPEAALAANEAQATHTGTADSPSVH